MNTEPAAPPPGATQLVSTAQAARTAITETVQHLVATGTTNPTIGLVPTMGALHEGHAALLNQAREENDVVVVSVFVNPLQFEDAADFENYPRTLDDDVTLLSRHTAGKPLLIFAPDTAQMYPGYRDFGDTPQITVSAGAMGEVFEGASRPGHFDGVTTVVTKLWNILMPPAPAALRSYFGRKDAQQLAILQRTAADLNIPVEIRDVDLVRAPSGLALSSRNQRLDDHGTDSALILSTALKQLRDAATAGEPLDVPAARTLIDDDATVTLDYLEVVDPATLTPLTDDELATPLRRDALALVAAVVPPVRLIDNMVLPAAGT